MYYSILYSYQNIMFKYNSENALIQEKLVCVINPVMSVPYHYLKFGMYYLLTNNTGLCASLVVTNMEKILKFVAKV